MVGSRNKTIFRPTRSGRGRGGRHGGQGGAVGGRQGELRRSRSWQGFTSGLRYESVSDAGMPPPPSGTPGASSSLRSSSSPSTTLNAMGPPPTKR